MSGHDETGFSGRLNIADADAFYASLIETIEAVPEARREEAMGRLILLLANAVGDRAVLDRVLATVRSALE